MVSCRMPGSHGSRKGGSVTRPYGRTDLPICRGGSLTLPSRSVRTVQVVPCPIPGSVGSRKGGSMTRPYGVRPTCALSIARTLIGTTYLPPSFMRGARRVGGGCVTGIAGHTCHPEAAKPTKDLRRLRTGAKLKNTTDRSLR